MYPTLLELADDLLDRGGALARVRGRPVRLTRADPDPFALLGVRFGPAIDAVACSLRASSGTAEGPVLAVDRCGDVVVVDGHRCSTGASEAPLVLDLARRSMGLTTAPATRPVRELIDAVWLDRLLRATLDAPLGDPPGWVALARLHPGGRVGPAASPEVLRHRAATAPSWSRLRHAIADGRARWPPVSGALAQWFDDGSLARHAFAVLPEPDTVLADLTELLRPADAARVDAVLNPR